MIIAYYPDRNSREPSQYTDGEDGRPERRLDACPHLFDDRLDYPELGGLQVCCGVDVVEGHEQAVAGGEAADGGQQDPASVLGDDPAVAADAGELGAEGAVHRESRLVLVGGKLVGVAAAEVAAGAAEGVRIGVREGFVHVEQQRPGHWHAAVDAQGGGAEVEQFEGEVTVQPGSTQGLVKCVARPTRARCDSVPMAPARPGPSRSGWSTWQSTIRPGRSSKLFHCWRCGW